MSFRQTLELTEQFPDYVQETVSLHGPYTTFLNNNEFQGNFLQWCLRNYEEANLRFNEEDFTLIIKHTDCQHLDLEGNNSLAIALLYGINFIGIPLTTEHFSMLLHQSDFIVKSEPFLNDRFGLIPLFVQSSETLFTPTSEEIFTILEYIVLQSKEQQNSQSKNWNALHYALYHGQIGQTFLEEKHFDYLFENFEYDLSKASFLTETKDAIINKKSQYDILKEKRIIEKTLVKNDKASLKPAKI